MIRRARPARAGLRVLAVWVAAMALIAPRGPGPSLAAADPAPRSEPADPVAAAAEAFAALRFDEALRLADQAWRNGDNGPDQLRRIFELAGRAAGSIGEDRAARLWFSRWLYLDPDAALPDGTSPKLTALFGDARATLAGAARAALRDGAAVVPVTAAAGEIREIREIDLVDRYGNRLAKIAVKIGVKPAPADVPAPAPAPSTEPAAPPARDASRAWYAHPVTWAVTTGVLAAAGGIELWIAVDARSELNNLDRHSSDHQYSEASPVLQRLDRAQLGAGVAFGAAAAAAVVGATLWLRDRGEPAVAVSPGAASVAWRARF